MRYRLWSASNTLLAASFLTGLGIVITILCIVGGVTPNAFESASIATFDLTAFRAELESTYSDSNITLPQISDWYSLHLTTVCHGRWTPATANRTVATTKEKENSTMTCVAHGLAWTFQLGSTLYPSSSTDFPELTALNAYSASITPPAVLYTTSAILSGLTVIGNLTTTLMNNFGPWIRRTCIAAVTAEFLAAVIALVASALLTSARSQLTPPAPYVAPIQSYASGSYLALVWLAFVIPLVAGAVGVLGCKREAKRAAGKDPKRTPVRIDAPPPGKESTRSSISKENNSDKNSGKKLFLGGLWSTSTSGTNSTVAGSPTSGLSGSTAATGSKRSGNASKNSSTCAVAGGATAAGGAAGTRSGRSGSIGNGNNRSGRSSVDHSSDRARAQSLSEMVMASQRARAREASIASRNREREEKEKEARERAASDASAAEIRAAVAAMPNLTERIVGAGAGTSSNRNTENESGTQRKEQEQSQSQSQSQSGRQSIETQRGRARAGSMPPKVNAFPRDRSASLAAARNKGKADEKTGRARGGSLASLAPEEADRLAPLVSEAGSASGINSKTSSMNSSATNLGIGGGSLGARRYGV